MTLYNTYRKDVICMYEDDKLNKSNHAYDLEFVLIRLVLSFILKSFIRKIKSYAIWWVYWIPKVRL